MRRTKESGKALDYIHGTSETCPKCEMKEEEACPDCGGDGYDDRGDPCRMCGGTGRVYTREERTK